MSYFDKFNNAGIPFMEGREKGNLSDMLDRPLHIVEFGFINGDDGEYAVMAFAEDAERFYFGNSIITEMLHTVKDDGMSEELAEQEITFVKRTSRNGKRTYTAYVF